MIGSVFKTVTEIGEQHYVVLPDGVARVNDTTAAALRATNSYGLIAPPSVEASVVAKIAEQVYTSPLPDKPLEILLREDAPDAVLGVGARAGRPGARRRRSSADAICRSRRRR